MLTAGHCCHPRQRFKIEIEFFVNKLNTIIFNAWTRAFIDPFFLTIIYLFINLYYYFINLKNNEALLMAFQINGCLTMNVSVQREHKSSKGIYLVGMRVLMMYISVHVVRCRTCTIAFMRSASRFKVHWRSWNTPAFMISTRS